MAYILLAGLPESFDAFASCKYEKIGKNLSDIGISKLVLDLIAEENRVQSANSQANRVGKKPAASACSHCQKPGYIEDKCFKKYPELYAEYKAKRDAKKDAKEPNSGLTKSLMIAQAVKTPKLLNLSLKSAQSLDLSPKLVVDESKINLEYFDQALLSKSIKIDFIIDSGATEHYIHNKDLLILYDLQAYNTPNRVLYVRLLFSEDKDYAVRA